MQEAPILIDPPEPAEIDQTIPENIALELAVLRQKVSILEPENAKLREANTELIAQLHELSKDAYFDILTGLRSRAFFENEMDYRIARVLRSEDASASIILCDIDHFKVANDTLGHAEGDKILRTVAQAIMNLVRDEDIAVRWGGEEIAVVMSDISPEDALVRAELIRGKVSEIIFEEHPEFKLTISVGVVSTNDLPSNNKNKEALFKTADDSLYASKNAGRNRVTAYSELPKQQLAPQRRIYATMRRICRRGRRVSN